MASKKPVAENDGDDVDLWNREDARELTRPTDITAFEVDINARDWTVETIVQQIKQGNIDLDPAFQRRNAWRDHRRSRLIESFVLSFPVPQIVLAENPRRKKSFIVIDGKQRLMTIAGMFLPEFRDYWKKPVLDGLEILEDLNGVTLDDFLSRSRYEQYRRQLGNSDIRTTVISGFKDEGVLYDVFYRINTGSVPLSSQELRQVLNRGGFAQYLLEITSEDNPLWPVLGIDTPDARLRDVELLLRIIAWSEFSTRYAGNMKQFLDTAMRDLNAKWELDHRRIEKLGRQIMDAISALRKIYREDAGRKFKAGRHERALNRALFEVQTVYLLNPTTRAAALDNQSSIRKAFLKLSEDVEFLGAIESTTKSLDNTRLRFRQYRKMLSAALNIEVPRVQIGKPE